MANLTEECSSKFNEPDFINLVITLYSKIDTKNYNLSNNVNKIKEDFRRINIDFAICKYVNSLLHERLLKEEKYCLD